jgi:hypothetical protein
MPSFDITSILDFDPPRYACPVCRALISHAKIDIKNRSKANDGPRVSCPICKVEFIKGQYALEDKQWYHWFDEQGSAISLGADLFEHARTLANVVKDSRGNNWREPWPTMRLLFEVLSRARSFVHFASWGISHQLVGVLKLTSIRVPVYGFEGYAKRSLKK